MWCCAVWAIFCLAVRAHACTRIASRPGIRIVSNKLGSIQTTTGFDMFNSMHRQTVGVNSRHEQKLTPQKVRITDILLLILVEQRVLLQCSSYPFPRQTGNIFHPSHLLCTFTVSHLLPLTARAICYIVPWRVANTSCPTQGVRLTLGAALELLGSDMLRRMFFCGGTLRTTAAMPPWYVPCQKGPNLRARSTQGEWNPSLERILLVLV